MGISKNRKLAFFAVLFFIIGAIGLIFSEKIKLTSYDYWWHLKTGEWITNNKQIPTHDIFGWYGIENNLKWISHEWLSALAIYGTTKLIGINLGGFIFALVEVLLLFLLLFLFNKRNYQNNIILSMIWIFVGTMIFSGFINPRPYLISYILFATTIYLCEQLRKNESSKKIYLLPIVSLLWTNFHGGSSNLVYIIPLCYLVPNLFDIKLYRLRTNKLTSKQIKKYTTNIVLSILMLAINPNGLDMILYPYVNMLDNTMQQYIAEWQALDLKTDLILGLFIFSIIFIGMFTKKDLKITDCILLFFFIILSFRSVRFIPMLYIVASFYVFKYIKQIRIKKLLYDLQIIFLLSGIVCLVFAIGIIGLNYNEIEMKKLISDEVTETIKENNYKKIFNEYGLGGYLIYNDIKVFIDGRADMYSSNIFENHMEMEVLRTNIKEDFEKYGFDAFIVSKETILDNYFKSSDDYKLIAEDEKISLYESI